MNPQSVICKIVALFFLFGVFSVQANKFKQKKNATELLKQTREYFNELVTNLDIEINKTKIYEFDDPRIIQNGTYEVDYQESMSSIYIYLTSEKMLQVSTMLDDAINNIKNALLNADEKEKHIVAECVEGQLHVVESAHNVLYTRIERCVQFKYQVYDENLKAIQYNRDEIVAKINATEEKCLNLKSEEIHAKCVTMMLPTIKIMTKEVRDFVRMTLEIKKQFYEPNEDCSIINFDSFNGTLITAQRNAHLCVQMFRDTKEIDN